MEEDRKSPLVQGQGFTEAVCLGRAGKAWAIDGSALSGGFLLNP